MPNHSVRAFPDVGSTSIYDQFRVLDSNSNVLASTNLNENTFNFIQLNEIDGAQALTIEFFNSNTSDSLTLLTTDPFIN